MADEQKKAASVEGGKPPSSSNEKAATAEAKKPATDAGEKAAPAEGGKAAPTADKKAAPKNEKKAASADSKKAAPAEITDKDVKTMQGRAHALAVTKELHKQSVDGEVAIRFDHVTKTYHLYKNDLARFFGLMGVKRKRAGYLGKINANDDLSFEVKKGEAVAFLGLNGAGKSTALKMVTGIVYPTSGTVEVNGRVSALLELSAGFDQQLTGRENIRLRGQIIGLSDEDIAEIEPAAIEFADLGMYIDQPMKSYSSGMRARLGFALAVNIHPEILVVDEALSVGDQPFRKKCITRIREIMMDENLTVFFVTHSTTLAQEFCSRGIVLDHGKKVFDGGMDEAMAFYKKFF